MWGAAAKQAQRARQNTTTLLLRSPHALTYSVLSPMENFMPRRSKFAEGTMNSTASIRPPPEVLWRETTDSETNLSANAEATHKKWPTSSVTQITEAAPASAPTHEGNIFGRFSRAAASLFRGQGFSGLGKRKREDDSQAKETRKEEVERAYADAKRLGLLPEPTVYVRPVRRRRSPGTFAQGKLSFYSWGMLLTQGRTVHQCFGRCTHKYIFRFLTRRTTPFALDAE